MNLEDRLRNHMQEQNDAMEFTVGDPSQITPSTGNKGAAVTAATAVLVLLLAGAGYLGLSNRSASNDVATNDTEVDDDNNNGETNNEDGDKTANDDETITGPVNSVVVTDISEGAPGGFAVNAYVGDDGYVYMLSTAPGVKPPSDGAPQSEWQKAFELNTLFSFSEQDGWNNVLTDRSLTDIETLNNSVYVLSTGSATSEALSLGVSTDHGKSLDWQPLEVPADFEATRLQLVSNQTDLFLLASRWAQTDWQVAMKAANAAGYDLSERDLYIVDVEGFSYVEFENPPECAALEAEAEDLQTEIQTETEGNRDEFIELIEETYQRLDQLGCYGPQICYDGNEDADCLTPIRVSWDSIGFEAPESWNAWAALYRIDDGALTELNLPDITFENLEVNKTTDELTLWAWPVMTEEISSDFDVERWESPDGISWSNTTDGSDPTFLQGWSQPAVGDTTFQMNWTEDGSNLLRSVAGGSLEPVAVETISGNPSDEYEGAYGAGFAVFVNILDPSSGQVSIYVTVDGTTWQATDMTGGGFPIVTAPGFAIFQSFGEGLYGGEVAFEEPIAEEVDDSGVTVVIPPTTTAEALETEEADELGSGSKVYLIQPSS